MRRAIEAAEGPARKRWMVSAVVFNLTLLGFFKYCNFFIENANALLGPFGVALPALNILLPAGISFYTFKTMSYTIDVYRRDLSPCRSWLDYATFVTFFPELIAGPIVRASVFLPQMTRDVGPTRERLSVVGLQGRFDGVGRVEVGVVGQVKTHGALSVKARPARRR